MKKIFILFLTILSFSIYSKENKINVYIEGMGELRLKENKEIKIIPFEEYVKKIFIDNGYRSNELEKVDINIEFSRRFHQDTFYKLRSKTDIYLTIEILMPMKNGAKTNIYEENFICAALVADGGMDYIKKSCARKIYYKVDGLIKKLI